MGRPGSICPPVRPSWLLTDLTWIPVEIRNRSSSQVEAPVPVNQEKRKKPNSFSSIAKSVNSHPKKSPSTKFTTTSLSKSTDCLVSKLNLTRSVSPFFITTGSSILNRKPLLERSQTVISFQSDILDDEIMVLPSSATLFL